MARLTEKRDGKNVIPLRQDGKYKWALCSAGQGDAPTKYLYGDHADRLAAYEDTGLEPNRITEFMAKWIEIVKLADFMKKEGITHLRDLIRTEKDGKLVNYLPGDTVYDRFGMEWTVTTTEIHRFDDGTLHNLYRCGHPGTDDYRALYEDEVLTREEAEAALGDGKEAQG